MANPTCSQAAVLKDCYRTDLISEKLAKALLIYAMELELAAIGGTDYTGRLPLLVQDANSLACGMEKADGDAALVNLAFRNATAAGASVPSGLNAQVAQTLCHVELSDDDMWRIVLLLTCKLGVHKTYPQ